MRLFLDVGLIATGWLVWDTHDDEPLLKRGEQIELPEIVPGLQTKFFDKLYTGIGYIIFHGVQQSLYFRREIRIRLGNLLQYPVQGQVDFIQHKRDESIRFSANYAFYIIAD